MQHLIMPFIFCIGLLLGTPLAYAQNWEWAKVSVPRYAYPVATTTDQQGNVYILQRRYSYISVTKLDTEGNTVYDKVFDQPEWLRAQSITTDAEGNVYLTGIYNDGQLSFGTFTLQSNYQGSMADIFIVKLNLLGNVVWAKNIAGPGLRSSLCVSNQGELLLSASIKEDDQYVDTTLNPFTTQAHFVARIDRTTGSVLWFQKVGTGINRAIDTDALRNIYTLAEVSDDYYHNNESYLVQLSPTGSFQWYKQVGGAAYDLTTDPAGNSYVAGRFEGNVDMGNGIQLNTVAHKSMMVAKYDANANTLWARAMDSNNPDDVSPDPEKFAAALDLDVDAKGSCYITGYYVRRYPDPQNGECCYSKHEGFLSKYTSQGGLDWVHHYAALPEAPARHAFAASISTAPHDQQYVTFGIGHIHDIFESTDGGLQLDDNFFVNYPNPNGNAIIAKFNTAEKVTLGVLNEAIRCFPCWPWDPWVDFEYRYWLEEAELENAVYRSAFGGEHSDEVYWEDEQTLIISLHNEDLAPGSYRFQMRALLEDGTTTQWASAVSFTMGASRGRVFPNPVEGVLTVQYQTQQTEEVRLELLNRFGETIQSDVRIAERGDNEWQCEVSDIRIEDNPLTLLLHSREGTQHWTLLRSR